MNLPRCLAVALAFAACVDRGSVGVVAPEGRGEARDVLDVDDGDATDITDVEHAADVVVDAADARDAAEPRCGPGFTACGARCVDHARDPEHCGGCGRACAQRGYVPERYGCFTGLCGDDVMDLSIGVDHACAVLRQGTVHCWGGNLYGQLGDGSLTAVLSGGTARVRTVGDAARVSCGASHTCALRYGGGVWCWGLNNAGQLGDGSLTNAPDAVEARLSAWASSVSVGARHSCAAAGGRAWCWGENEHGELGTGDIDNRYEPTLVQGLDGVTDVRVGSAFACARVGVGVWCWGEHGQGQRAIPPTEPAPRVATRLAASDSGRDVEVRQLSLGSVHGCALDSNGRAYCWGGNYWGQLGRGETSDWETFGRVRFPADRENFKTVVTAPGGNHTCAIDEDWRVFCWGLNGNGQVGDATTRERIDAPVQVTFAPLEFVSLHLGHQASCAITRDRREVWCWGDGALFGVPAERAVRRPRRVDLVPPRP